jgi:hypothetical protein
VQGAALAATASLLDTTTLAADAPSTPAPSTKPSQALAPRPQRSFLTPAKDFTDVSRGTPKPFTLVGAAREAARLTPDTWRLEIVADPFIEDPIIKLPASIEHPRTITAGNAIDFAQLQEFGKAHEVTFLKAMQCLNISTPLGQGLWTGVPLRDFLRHFCGKMSNIRRIYFHGYHNNDPKQIFQSSLSYTQVMETPPGDLPAFVAYRLNGEPIPIERGGPVRMVVPWAHGFKSIKWLQQIFLTNDFRANDTYANSNNDPESYLKTAAYLDSGPEKIRAGEPLQIAGQAISGLSGLKGVEYWVREVHQPAAPLADDAAELLQGPWVACQIQEQPDWKHELPAGVLSSDVLGFEKATGQPIAWPLRYSMVSYSATINGLTPGHYEVRARAADLNGFAQPEPRPAQKTGKNAIQVRRIQVV